MKFLIPYFPQSFVLLPITNGYKKIFLRNLMLLLIRTLINLSALEKGNLPLQINENLSRQSYFIPYFDRDGDTGKQQTYRNLRLQPCKSFLVHTSLYKWLP